MESLKDTHEVPEGETCFKCKTKISHVPYKFEGNFFHARCLVCNTCGKRLIGKPFVTADCEIFCNNKCLELFHSEGPKIQQSTDQVQSHNPVTPHQIVTNGVHNIDHFSLNGLLDTMQNRTYLYQGYEYNGRVTDYPSVMSNHNHSFQSETDSLSTVSESSFTSDSSFAYDANRKPKKKILKKSNGPTRAKHKRRVRWNFDNLESFSDIDSASLDSSSSLSSCGRSYYRSQELAFQYASNGHDPPRPTTKTTSDYPYHQNAVKLFSPPSSSSISHSNGVNTTSHQHHPSIYRTHSGTIYRPKAAGQSSHHPAHHSGSPNGHSYRNRSASDSHQDVQQTQVHHSSPLANQIKGSSSSLNRSMDRIINVPVLQLEDVPELNDSNLEERCSRNLFEFPKVSSQNQNTNTLNSSDSDLHLSVPHLLMQRSRSSSDVSNPQSLTSNSSSSMSSQSTSSFTPISTFLPLTLRGSSPADSPPIQNSRSFPLKRVPENDDEHDYDHLGEEDSPPVPSGPTAEECLKPLKSNNQWYSSDDIDEALQIIEGSEQENECEEDKPSPPPLPPKQRNLKTRQRPPVPSKKHVLDSIMAQEVTHDDSSHNETIDGLIISLPPQCFRGSNTEYSRQDPLHSPSSETLMPNDTSQSDSNLTPLEPEIHPEAKLNTMVLKQSWSETMDDRIIEGAEDPHRKRQSPTTIPIDPSTGFVPTVNTVFTDHNTTTHSHNGIDKLSDNIKMAESFAPLQRQNSFSPKLSREDQSEHAKLHRSKTLPKNIALTKEDKAILKWYRERPQMKPVIVDTDREIDDMMAEMEKGKDKDKNGINRRSPRQSLDSQDKQLLGPCFACKKPVDDVNSLVNFASRTYHSSCFCCSHCRCLLKGTQIYTLQGVLMCYSDYSKIIAKQQTEQLSKIHKFKNKRSHSSSSLSSLKSREDIVISPPMQSLEHSYNKNTTMV